MPATCPLSSVEKRTFGFSGFPEFTVNEIPEAAFAAETQKLTDSESLIGSPARNESPYWIPSNGSKTGGWPY